MRSPMAFSRCVLCEVCMQPPVPLLFSSRALSAVQHQGNKAINYPQEGESYASDSVEQDVCEDHNIRWPAGTGHAQESFRYFLFFGAAAGFRGVAFCFEVFGKMEDVVILPPV